MRRPRRRRKPTTARPGTIRPCRLPDRMKLAEGRPLPRRMMAAMAQQDCSQCGYNCKDYADALFAKKEERLNLCVPGGKDTARMLKQLYQEFGTGAAASGDAAAEPAAAPLSAPGRSRDNPVDGDAHLAPPPQQARLRKGDLAYRIRSCRVRPRLCRRRFFRGVSRQRSGTGRGRDRSARCAAGFPDRRAHVARRAHRRRLAVAGARHAVPAHLVSHRRRAPAEGEGAGRRPRS